MIWKVKGWLFQGSYQIWEADMNGHIINVLAQLPNNFNTFVRYSRLMPNIGQLPRVGEYMQLVL